MGLSVAPARCRKRQSTVSGSSTSDGWSPARLLLARQHRGADHLAEEARPADGGVEAGYERGAAAALADKGCRRPTRARFAPSGQRVGWPRTMCLTPERRSPPSRQPPRALRGYCVGGSLQNCSPTPMASSAGSESRPKLPKPPGPPPPRLTTQLLDSQICPERRWPLRSTAFSDRRPDGPRHAF